MLGEDNITPSSHRPPIVYQLAASGSTRFFRGKLAHELSAIEDLLRVRHGKW
jgi:hypothetical protein